MREQADDDDIERDLAAILVLVAALVARCKHAYRNQKYSREQKTKKKAKRRLTS